jgi:predicted Zn finger-like uncharacterized protein
MILTCEKCSKRYLVKDEEIGPEGRKVRCVACNHTWVQSAIESMMPLKIDPMDIPAHPHAANESIPPRFSFGWIVFCLSIMLLLGSGYFGRHMIVQTWPVLTPIYETLGFEVLVPGQGLKVENVQPNHTEHDGKTILVVRGEVVNTSKHVQVIPPIHIQLMGPCEVEAANQCVLKEWQHAFSESRLLPGERIAFETEPQETLPNAKNIRVQF